MLTRSGGVHIINTLTMNRIRQIDLSSIICGYFLLKNKYDKLFMLELDLWVILGSSNSRPTNRIFQFRLRMHILLTLPSFIYIYIYNHHPYFVAFLVLKALCIKFYSLYFTVPGSIQHNVGFPLTLQTHSINQIHLNVYNWEKFSRAPDERDPKR